MGALSDIGSGVVQGAVNSVTNALGVSSGSSGSSLKGFLSKYTSSESLYVNEIDPLNTFDITFEFWPRKGQPKSGSGNIVDSVVDSVVGTVKSSVKNALNNVTGGLLGTAMNQGKVTDEKGYDGTMTFIEYLCRGNMLTGTGDWVGGTTAKVDTQLVMDFSYYVQNVQLPQIQSNDGDMIETLMGQFPVNGTFVKPSQNTIQLEIINTKAPLAERIFYPWLREVTTPLWHYTTQPYSTADVKISFEKHQSLTYVFVNCRPSQIETMKPSNELQTPIRSVTLMFDYMFVQSNLERCDSLKSKVSGMVSNTLGGLGSLF